MKKVGVLLVLFLAIPAWGQKTAEPAPPEFHHEMWGRTYYGEGYVYGPTLWRSSLAVADLDVDGDDDFVFRPHYTESAYVMRNLGSSGAFYPGGAREVPMAPPVIGAVTVNLDVVMDFEDVTGDGRPDMLAAAYKTGDAEETYIVWYSNMGSAFQYQGLLYTSPQHTLAELALTLADINGDGLQDIFFMEPYLGDAAHPHHVFLKLNTGTSTVPVWGAPTEITQLSTLLPPLLSGAKAARLEDPTHDARTRGRVSKAVGLPRVSDIEVADWNVDGTLDFLFYDAEQGIDWVRNTGTTTDPEWATSINDTMRAPWRHTQDEIGDYGIPADYHEPMDVVFGSFAVRTNPGALLPDAKWLDDFYVAMDGWLITRRYFTDDDAYRLTQETCVEYATGQGPAAFWDYDGDGDLDLFRTGISDAATRGLLLFPNIGSVYAPGWGRYQTMSGVALSPGTDANTYRQDLYAFADPDGDGYSDLFVQGQNGRIRQYWADEAAGPGLLPTFTLWDTDFGSLGQWTEGLDPHGLCFADFDGSGDGQLECVAAFASGTDAIIVYYSPYWDWTGDLTESLWESETTTTPAYLVESLAAADVDLDGRPDLVAVLSEQESAQNCRYAVYRNVPWEDAFYFEYCGDIEAPVDEGHTYGRMATMADIDGDGDSDLFTGHQHVANTYRRNYMRFYRNGGDTGLDYWRTRVVSGQSWQLSWNGELPDYAYVVNASGGTTWDPGWYTAGAASPVVDVIESTDLDRNVRVFVDVLPPVGEDESKAILIVGGAANDSLHQTFMALAGFAYWVLRSEGLPGSSIQLLAAGTMDGDDDGTDDVYALPTLGNVEEAITNWASGCPRLLVYMIDHGRRESFRVNGTQYLDAATYAEWVNQLGTATQVTTIIDTCEAGSFVDNLALSKEAIKSGAERITITSSGIGAIEGIALFDQTQYLSFSLGFWQEVFNGATYGQAFERAKVSINSINPLQVPQIDDDGDGRPNEANDGLLASTARPGADFELPALGVCIGDVAPLQVVNSSSVTLWLADVFSSFPVEAAGALIVPPNFQRPSLTGDDEQPVTGLTWINLTFNQAMKRWQSVFSGLNEGGLFRVQYYVKALGRWYVSPRIGYVDRIGIADAWEPDNSAAAAQWLPANSVQGHNFHTSGDVDWLRFTSPPGQEVTFAAIAPGYRCRPVVTLYAEGNLTTPLREVAAPAPGRSVVFNHVFTAAGEYLIRFSNAAGLIGEGTSYLALAAVGTGGADIVPSTLLVTVIEGSAPVSGAAVRFDATVSCTTGANGSAQFLCTSYGNYSVQVTKAGYNSVTQTVAVNNLFENTVITIEAEGSEGEGEGEEPGGGCAGGRLDGGTPRGGTGAAALLVLAAAVMAAAARKQKQYRSYKSYLSY